MRRLLPPLLFLAVLGLVALRALQGPDREVDQARIEAVWETSDAAARAELLEQVERHAEAHGGAPDRPFVSHAFLRCRRVDLAIQARWPDLARGPDPAQARAFAREALRVLGWDDEARRRPTSMHAPISVALVDGGDEAIARELDERIASERVEWLYAFMRQAPWSRSPATRRVLAAGCRKRALNEPRGPGADPAWSVAAALLAYGPEPYPQRDADRAQLLAVLEGPFRVQFRGRWMLACRALGQGRESVALEALQRVAERLASSQDPIDRHDRAVVHLALLAGGAWEGEVALEAIFRQGQAEVRLLAGLAVSSLADRAMEGDERAIRWVEDIWQGPGATAPALREHLARGVLSEAPAGKRPPWTDLLLEDLEMKGTPEGLAVHALVARLREGAPQAREALLRWLVREAGPGVLEGVDPEKASIPALTALRALHLPD